MSGYIHFSIAKGLKEELEFLEGKQTKKMMMKITTINLKVTY